MPNKFLKEYVESKNNKQSNYEQILSKVGGVNKMNVLKIKFTRIAAVVVAILMLIVGVPQVYAKIQWNIEFKEFKNRDYKTGIYAIKDEYTEVIEMDYVEQNGIKAKIGSLNITDDHFEAIVDFEFEQGIEVNSETFSSGFAIYDDEKNVYGIFSKPKSGEKYDKTPLYIYEDLGIKYNKKDIYAVQLQNACSTEVIEVNGRTIKAKISMDSIKGFPRSKKIYIRLFDLGFFMADNETKTMETFTVSDNEWIFEIDVPEKFYERLTINLKLKEEIPGVEISKLAISENGLIVRGIFDGSNDVIFAGKDMTSEQWSNVQDNLLYITDNEGNRYQQLSFGTDTKEDSICAKFDVTKNIFEQSGLWLNYTDINGKLYKTELVKK